MTEPSQAASKSQWAELRHQIHIFNSLRFKLRN
ncbi:hypothetical protein GJJ30_26805 [Larkinella terrae]|uniref:QLQ domain-containing protein n=1 Tax=Larkinella terrae TaxID=2025311 RepID=A0A7K0ET00_9BACT|nr:hypothetical protein [Larkinella terrae]